MKLINIEGIVAVIDNEPNAVVKLDEQGRFMLIPMDMAKRMVKEGIVKPLRLEHNVKLPDIGRALKFKIIRRSIYEQEDENKDAVTEERDMLVMEGVIDNQSFIHVLQQVGQMYNTDDKPGDYYSPDGFIKGGNNKKGDKLRLDLCS